MSIHSTAIVSGKANIADGVDVGPGAVIGDNVTIGPGTKIGAHCVIDGNTSIGRDCEIFTGAIVGSRPQDLKFKGEESYLIIGDRNVIREYCTLNPGTGEGGKTVIGDANLLMAYCHVAHDCRVGNNCVIANNGTLAGHVTVGDRCIVGGMAAVHQFVRVGTLSILGGCSKVVQDIPPYSTCDGHPARVYGLNLIGLRRNGIGRETIGELNRAYREIFYSGVPLRKAAIKFEAENSLSKETAYLIDFIKTSQRGVSRSCRIARSSAEAAEQVNSGS
ncbi:MAG: acyl-ACP--UDP-N-acetylglucosamine O-acyltransferase [Candidatus Omnitrophota bacterium]